MLFGYLLKSQGSKNYSRNPVNISHFFMLELTYHKETDMIKSTEMKDSPIEILFGQITWFCTDKANPEAIERRKRAQQLEAYILRDAAEKANKKRNIKSAEKLTINTNVPPT
jgi:hypothetical protein